MSHLFLLTFALVAGIVSTLLLGSLLNFIYNLFPGDCFGTDCTVIDTGWILFILSFPIFTVIYFILLKTLRKFK